MVLCADRFLTAFYHRLLYNAVLDLPSVKTIRLTSQSTTGQTVQGQHFCSLILFPQIQPGKRQAREFSALLAEQVVSYSYAQYHNAPATTLQAEREKATYNIWKTYK
jgi:hypothetical protein